MIQVFLSYDRRDGIDVATRLRDELTTMGFTVWRDIEEMPDGLAWKEQLRAALRQVDAVLVLLTPGSVASRTVEWEWENALTLGKRVIGLLVRPCDVPAELPHYYDLSDPARYTLGLAKLTRDLVGLAVARPAPAQPPAAGVKYQVGTAIGSTVGDFGVTVNQAGLAGFDAAAIARLVQVLRSQAPGDPAVQAEARAILRDIGSAGTDASKAVAERRTALQNELQTYRRNLDDLRLQAAKHGGVDYAPTALRNEIRDTQIAIERIEQELANLGD